MSNTIDRQAAIDAINSHFGFNIEEEYGSAVQEVINSLPSAQPETGKWISADAIFGGVPFYCSECGENTRDTVMGKPRWKFCPMCGSRNEVTT